MKSVCTIIPVYKEQPSNDEVISIKRTFEILSDYDLVLVCPERLETNNYFALMPNSDSTLNVYRFPNEFFNDIQGYNKLLLSPSFYRKFKEYDYILICQPDAFVFRDELSYWCSLGFDFIGAPLVGSFYDTTFSETMRVGNGGFSLRNVQTMIRFFESKKNVFTPSQAAKRISLWKKPYTRIWIWLLMILGWHNKPIAVASEWKYNEDDFWSGLLDQSNYALSKPSPSIAMKFSFERFPAELFQLNDKSLPFGCHAWKKYQYNEFWSNFISCPK